MAGLCLGGPAQEGKPSGLAGNCSLSKHQQLSLICFGNTVQNSSYSHRGPPRQGQTLVGKYAEVAGSDDSSESCTNGSSPAVIAYQLSFPRPRLRRVSDPGKARQGNSAPSLHAGILFIPQQSRHSPAFARSKLKMCRARAIASCSFPLLAGDFDKLRDRSRIAASASSIRCSNLLRSDSMMAAR